MLDLLWYQTVLAVVCVCVCWLFWENFKNRERWSLLSKVPGMKPRFLVGNVRPFTLLRNLEPRLYIAKSFQIRLGLSNVFHKDGLFVMWLFRKPLVVLTRPATVEPILSSYVSINKGALYNLATPMLGNGLVTSSGEKWRRDRKMLTPAFHFRILDHFISIMNEQAAILVRKFEDRSEGKDWIDPQMLVTMCTMDIICETAMGVKIGAQKKPSSFSQRQIKATDALLYRLYRPWLHPNSIYFLTSVGKELTLIVRGLHDFTESLIEKKIQEKLERGQKITEPEDNVSKKRLAFLDLILESDMTKTELRDQVNTFISAGHDTTSATLNWILYVLGLELEVQSRLGDELHQVLGQEDRPVTQEDLKGLKYMDCVIKEVQRLYCTVPAISRMLDQDTMLGGYLIPKGTECIISISSVHRDPAVYPDPERFDPDRFLPQNSLGRHPFAFIPFSAGSRNCIGQRYSVMEMKVVLCHILRKFVLKSLDKRDVVLELPEIILRPVGKLRIQFTPKPTKL